METTTLTRAALSKVITKNIGVSRSEGIKIFETILDEVIHCLEKGEHVKLSGFGSFHVREKSPRLGRNPRTGESALITARRVLVFKPSHILKDSINV